MAINLHLLRLFTTVAEQHGFSRAAEVLNISQPAVSKGVRELEAQLHCVLMERSPGGVRLTEAGTVLLSHATALFAAERRAEEELQALRGLTQGELHVGASTTIATYVLPRLLGAFQDIHPDLHLRLTSANTQDIAERLLARDIDVALVEGPVEHPNLITHPWLTDELVVIAAADHPLARMEGPILPSDLAQARHIVREEGSGTREVVGSALDGFGVRPASIMEVGSTEAIKQVVAAGLGIAMVSAAAAKDQIALGVLKVVPVQGLSVERPLYRLTLKGHNLRFAAEAFEHFICQTDLRPVAHAPMAPAPPAGHR
ncbi:MAG TPA: LysR substrate-binding domain-containing protein [Xanthobacteraceae bacterium]|jgi:DNA-binding transcriptional LysR family regulator|uniref:LysR substrate-binding domain-containing protein n=1 Tax=Roseixanthobacter finlandensis TaxID=3119922 RepID=UPI002BED1DBA|nr:LysR substrate-binding domain-containing protein [Xanthobacteraceae bacterium]HQS49463.1 LysR substrate-binding domain-containing protein [Xanthobacteraceae bacterium]